MARKTKTLEIVIRCTVADNQQSATVDSIQANSVVEETQSGKPAFSNPGTGDPLVWDGTKTGDTIVADVLASLKGKYGT